MRCLMRKFYFDKKKNFIIKKWSLMKNFCFEKNDIFINKRKLKNRICCESFALVQKQIYFTNK